MQFLQNDKGGAERIPTFMLVPRLKISRDFERTVLLNFSIKMKADTANLCDEKVRRAWEDCEFLDRRIDSVRLKLTVENTDIDFYDLPDSKNPYFSLKNVTIGSLLCERSDGTTYLYFGCECVLAKTVGLGKWAVERFGTEMFAEFRPSQGALAFPMRDFASGGVVEAPDAGLLGAIDRLASTVRNSDGGVTSMEIRMEGMDSVVIDKQAAENIHKAAKNAKGKRS